MYVIVESRKQRSDDSHSGRISVGSFDDSAVPSRSPVCSSAARLVPTSSHPLFNPRVVQASPQSTSPCATRKASRTSDPSSSHSSPFVLTPYGYSSPSSGPRSLPMHSTSPGKEPGLVTRLFAHTAASPPMQQHHIPIHTAFVTAGRVNVNTSPTIYGQSVPHRYVGRRNYTQTCSPTIAEQIQQVSMKEHNSSHSPVLDKFIHRSNTEPCIVHFQGAYGMSPPMQALEAGFVSPQYVCRNRSTPCSVSPSPNRTYLVGTSPPIMEGPIEFCAPRLSEETIMDVSSRCLCVVIAWYSSIFPSPFCVPPCLLLESCVICHVCPFV